ncbi:MAG: hypothetical protein PHO10_01115 [Gemmiger sp.]|nr:hypothetical protein [Gemmiger sp.]
MANTLEEIAEMIEKTKFRRKLLGGVDEADAWRVMHRLVQEYTDRIDADRKTMLREMRADKARIAALEAQLAAQPPPEEPPHG